MVLSDPDGAKWSCGCKWSVLGGCKWSAYRTLKAVLISSGGIRGKIGVCFFFLRFPRGLETLELTFFEVEQIDISEQTNRFQSTSFPWRFEWYFSWAPSNKTRNTTQGSTIFHPKTLAFRNLSQLRGLLMIFHLCGPPNYCQLGWRFKNLHERWLHSLSILFGTSWSKHACFFMAQDYTKVLQVHMCQAVILHIHKQLQCNLGSPHSLRELELLFQESARGRGNHFSLLKTNQKFQRFGAVSAHRRVTTPFATPHSVRCPRAPCGAWPTFPWPGCFLFGREGLWKHVLNWGKTRMTMKSPATGGFQDFGNLYLENWGNDPIWWCK